MVVNRTKILSYALPLTLVLTSGCGSSPPEGSASASTSSTGGSGSSGGASNSDSDPTPGSNSNSDRTPTTTQGSMSEGQTEATTAGTTGTASVASITDTSATGSPTSDTDGTTTLGDTGTTGGDTGTTGTSTGELTASTGGSTTGGSSSTGVDGSSGTTGEPVQCGLQLKATIRDFKVGHPDFETYCCGVVQGLVKPDLGADKKPVFNQVGNPKMLTDAPTFNQWYNNVPDINQSTQIVLDLMEIQPGVYSYQNNNFFPIDNMLFGNQGNNHNFHFTTVPDTS